MYTLDFLIKCNLVLFIWRMSLNWVIETRNETPKSWNKQPKMKSFGIKFTNSFGKILDGSIVTMLIMLQTSNILFPKDMQSITKDMERGLKPNVLSDILSHHNGITSAFPEKGVCYNKFSVYVVRLEPRSDRNGRERQDYRYQNQTLDGTQGVGGHEPRHLPDRDSATDINGQERNDNCRQQAPRNQRSEQEFRLPSPLRNDYQQPYCTDRRTSNERERSEYPSGQVRCPVANDNAELCVTQRQQLNQARFLPEVQNGQTAQRDNLAVSTSGLPNVVVRIHTEDTTVQFIVPRGTDVQGFFRSPNFMLRMRLTLNIQEHEVRRMVDRPRGNPIQTFESDTDIDIRTNRCLVIN